MLRRINAIMSGLADACDETLTLHRVAARAARVLVDQFPGSAAVFFERDLRPDLVRAVAGADIPPAWHMRTMRVEDVPLIAEVVRRPTVVARGAVVRGARDASTLPQHAGRDSEALCAAIPGLGADPLHMLLFITPAEPGEAELRAVAVDSARLLLCATASLAAGGAARARTLSAIHHAKIEWQQVIDALPDITGLVDRRRWIVRISRALERWSIGDVRCALGSDLHDALHPNCRGADCGLRAAVETAWFELESRPASSVEVADGTLGRHVVLQLFAGASPRGAEGGGSAARVAFIVSDVTMLRRAEHALTEVNRTLEQRVADRTEQLTRANFALRAEVARRRDVERSLRGSQDELQALSERLMNAQEEERKRIARDLHDSVGQSLSAVKYTLERARVLLPREEIELAEEVLGTAVEWVKRVMEDVRCISMNLRPAQLDHLGAASAVHWLCRQWRDVYQTITVGTDIAVSDADIPQPLAISVFRAVQESLNNVARHSGASRVQVSIHLDEGTLRVVIQDDGDGFESLSLESPHATAAGRSGLRGLHERAEQTGGRCEVASAPGQGTRVQLEWPLAAAVALRPANTFLN